MPIVTNWYLLIFKKICQDCYDSLSNNTLWIFFQKGGGRPQNPQDYFHAAVINERILWGGKSLELWKICSILKTDTQTDTIKEDRGRYGAGFPFTPHPFFACTYACNLASVIVSTCLLLYRHHGWEKVGHMFHCHVVTLTLNSDEGSYLGCCLCWYNHKKPEQINTWFASLLQWWSSSPSPLAEPR